MLSSSSTTNMLYFSLLKTTPCYFRNEYFVMRNGFTPYVLRLTFYALRFTPYALRAYYTARSNFTTAEAGI